jgi:hypothetical protein
VPDQLRVAEFVVIEEADRDAGVAQPVEEVAKVETEDQLLVDDPHTLWIRYS